MHPPNKDARRRERYIKGMRRVLEDRAQHGSDLSCLCFDANGTGKAFARFADYPQACSCMACGNPRRRHGERTLVERRLDNPWLMS